MKRIKEAYIQKAINPYMNNPYLLMGSPAKGKTSAVLTLRLKTNEKQGYKDGMELFNDLIGRNKDSIEIKNIVKYVEVMIDEPSLAKTRYFELFASESLPSIRGIIKRLDNDLLPTSDPNAKEENLKRQIQGKSVTKTYIKGLLKKEPNASLDTYTCTNDIQLAYAVVLHCLRLEIRIKKCSECGKYFSTKNHSSMCETCRINSKNKSTNKSKERIEYRLYKAIYDTLMNRGKLDLIEEMQQGYTQFELAISEEEEQKIRVQKLAFLMDFSKREEVNYKPRSKDRKELVEEVERILREERNNG